MIYTDCVFLYFSMFRLCDVCYIYSTFFVCKVFMVQSGGAAESRSDEGATPLCIHKYLTNETNVSVNVLCHG